MKPAVMTLSSLTRALLATGLLLTGPALAQTTSRTEVITYSDNTAKWVLGQTASVTCVAAVPASASCDGNDVVSATTYDPNTALPTASYVFGKLQQTATYNTDGTLASVKDGRNNVTTFSNWKRGIPQTIQYADGTAQSAVVDNNGWISAVTDALGATTCYGFDAMGRLSRIEYPNESTNACDTAEIYWKKLTRSFVPVAAVEYGIPAGHWRLTESTGNTVKITYYDGLWRPLLVRAYDAGNVAGTERFVHTAYDADGRVSFQSYPSNSSSPTTGVWTLYDALGRVTSVSQDSEQGLLTTTTAYNAGFTTTVTNPRGQAATTAYLTYDQPSTDWPISISAPEGQTTTLTRDPYGKPLAISRGGVTRSYGYNLNQELCRSEEPETGTTLYTYDAAGNLSASAAGLPTGTACGSTNTRTVSRSFDARNRLQTLAFPDGNGNQSWAYTADGLPSTVTTANSGTTVTNTYGYNKRRLLTSESMAPDAAQSWSIGYTYDALGQRILETRPGSVTVAYAVNALGQTTQITARTDTEPSPVTVASNASYYPNGALKQFTYGNGIVHTMTQNARQLPSRSTDGSVLDLVTSFDANGNVSAVTDYTASARQTKAMAYDDLDRLTSTTSPMFGTATYRYDTQDNLTQASLSGGSLPRIQYYCYSANNQLAFVRSGPQCTGNASPATMALSYDVQGNVLQKTGTTGGTYTFDYGNRLRGTAGQTYRYDADGRRVRSDTNGSQLQYSQYAKDGRLLWQRDEVTGKRINNVYLAGSLLAEIARPIGSTTPTISYFHTDALGSPIAKTNAAGAIIETSEYEPYGRLGNRPNDNRAGYTGHVMDSASGLINMQQRMFDPQIGLFLSVDPVTAYSNGDMRFFGRYVYANNNPYRFTDPDGRQSAEHWVEYHRKEMEAGRGQQFESMQKPAMAATAFMLGGPLGAEALYARGMVWAGQNYGKVLLGGELAAGAAGVTGTAGALQSTGGVVRQFEQAAPQNYFRVFSGDSTVGRWLTSAAPKSSAWAQEALSLPPSNKATMIQRVLVPAGTRLERSRASPVPEWGRMRGGAEQFKLIDPIPPENFGPGVRLP